MFFPYGEAEISHLKARDRRLSAAIDRIGRIEREVRPELFSALVHSIVGQPDFHPGAGDGLGQNQRTPRRGNAADGPRSAAGGAAISRHLVSEGFLYPQCSRKGCERCTRSRNAWPISRRRRSAAFSHLSTGIGVWTAEMLMTFSMQRPDIISYGDLAIRRGLRMLYRHREITRERFERYRRRYSPYATVASLYLWAIAGGAMPELSDPAPKEAKR